MAEITRQWKNLAPALTRQRVIIEGLTEKIVEPAQMKQFLSDIATVLGMEVLSGPFAYSAHEMGYGGWIHWKSSGAHIYSYPTTPPLITVDIYTCKPFDGETAATYVQDYFQCIDCVFREIDVNCL